MKAYYAHFMGIYNTPQEKRDITTLEALGLVVINPNNPEVQKQCKEQFSNASNNVEYLKAFDSIFNPIIDQCEVFAFKALPDGRIPGGVAKELAYAQKNKKIIIELPSGMLARSMDGDSTREYLRDIGQR